MTGTFTDPAGTTRVAVAAVCLYMALWALAALLRLSDPDPGGPADFATAAALVVTLGCYVVVGRWIYRTNANAHALSDDMSISPGWSIGWFFVPFANLVQPYLGVKETWRASHFAAGLDDGAESALLPWWWGLWLLTNLLNNFVEGVGGTFERTTPVGLIYMGLVAAAVKAALCVVLVRLMQRLARVQILALHTSAFA